MTSRVERRRPIRTTGPLPQRVHVGTSGFVYPDWRGAFYPPEVRTADQLGYYATQFDTLELNTSFYRLPSVAAVERWNHTLSPRFHLVAKGPRLITHLHKLAHSEDAERVFFERMLPLRALKLVLWQLPPMLKKDVARLDAFLSRLPRTLRHAVEFRHPTWWDDDVARTLAAHDAAFVAISHPALPDGVIPTGDLIYLRFHGLGEQLYDWVYSKTELRRWARRVRPLLDGRALYAFFNNDWNAQAPRDARVFRELLLSSGAAPASRSAPPE